MVDISGWCILFYVYVYIVVDEMNIMIFVFGKDVVYEGSNVVDGFGWFVYFVVYYVVVVGEVWREVVEFFNVLDDRVRRVEEFEGFFDRIVVMGFGGWCRFFWFFFFGFCGVVVFDFSFFRWLFLRFRVF